jgi:hypothetical protein
MIKAPHARPPPQRITQSKSCPPAIMTFRGWRGAAAAAGRAVGRAVGRAAGRAMGREGGRGAEL